MNPGSKLLGLFGPMLVAVVFFLAGCGVSGGDGSGSPPEGGTSGEEVSLGDTEGLLWGDEGDRGAVLAHGDAYDAASWEEQALALVESGVVSLAVEDTAADNLTSAVDYLREEYDVESVALIGASAGTGPVLEAAREAPEDVTQLIVLSGTGDVSGLGEFPKLFVASEGEGIAGEVRRIAEEAPGDENEAVILLGDAHAQAIFRTEEGERLTQEIQERIEEHG